MLGSWHGVVGGVVMDDTVLVGRCKDCKWWEEIPSTGCPIVITTEEADENHMTPPDFGCVRWEAKDE